ncbi:MAG TPA: hypothetical protein VLG27_03165 [Candidatus Saccharimonadia bacterium]|nr:hypothetical protein [Candidatus Saccharimonadia bacterium]
MSEVFPEGTVHHEEEQAPAQPRLELSGGKSRGKRSFRPRLPGAEKRAAKRANKPPRTFKQKARIGGAIAIAVTGVGAYAYFDIKDQLNESHQQTELLKQQNAYESAIGAASMQASNIFDTWMKAPAGSANASTCAEHEYVLSAGTVVDKQPTPVRVMVGEELKTNIAYTITSGEQAIVRSMLVYKNSSNPNAHQLGAFVDKPAAGVSEGSALEVKQGAPQTANRVARAFGWIDLTEAKTNGNATPLRLPNGPNHDGGEVSCPWTTHGQPTVNGELAAWSVIVPEIDETDLGAIQQAIK